ncbi:hypothetical protein [Azospira restricta]|uniref:Uncharacterized protein n=1 Tax=Azospira restricta TaxID=404405 RepID=A0A974SPM2_9RHOO|nr:hypothetical protein [Azospira restricta]QRJ64094.1 hypothetical protein IWH25_01690 [Azospira restricta]
MPTALQTMDTPLAARCRRSALLCALALAGAAGVAGAEERWLYLGDIAPTMSWPTGQVSIDLASLRERGRRHEIWERTLYLPEPAQQWTWLPGDGPPERRTLWAIRCSRAAMAVITRGLSGSFEPRAEVLRYYVPAPGSADGAVLEATCARVRRTAPATEPQPPEPLPEDQRAAWRILERPPPVFIDLEDEDD